ncbi:MAG TPA: hypothetical protein VFL17_09965 [Anaerolineae bacterium]|nr:hypothetical protein [Anaerolineae bacterium]
MQPDSSILVAVMNSPRDFEIARDEGWYRIPQRSAPKFFPPEFVAFYFTKPFEQDAYSVRWYAKVRGHELASRRQLFPGEADHPRADHVYYKLQLGPLVELPHPIPSKRWRRLTFILTTGGRLFGAWEINDLVVGSREHDLMWRALKEAGLHAERDDELPSRKRVDFLLPCSYGDLGIVVSDEAPAAGEVLMHFTPKQINESLDDCIYQIQSAVTERGGLTPPSSQP